MHKLRLMTYPLGLSMDPTKGGLAIQGAHHGHVGEHEFAFDPGFTERAAKFSIFGSSTTSYNLQHRSQPYSLYDTTTLSEPDCQPSSSSASFSAAARVSLSGARDRSQHLSELASEFEHPNHPEGLGIHPRLEAFEGADNSRGTAKMLVNNRNNESSDLGEAHENSSCSGQAGKRKISSPESLADVEITCTRDSKGDEVHAKRLKAHGVGMNEADELKLKIERSASEHSGDSSPRSLKANSKPSEPSKLDYIHVRARRGQATDSHSLAERVRREKISERMKFLQDLVPGCSKVIGKAVMLDEIINYVQSLQRQIEFLSMKLAAVNPRPEFNFDNFLNKEVMMQTRSPETTLMGPDPLPGALSYGEPQYQRQMLQQQILPGSCGSDFRTMGTACDAYLRRSSSMQVPVSLQVSPEAYSDPLSQTEGLCDGDLQSVVEMGFIHNRQGSFNQGLHGFGFMLPGNLKVEL